MRSHLVTVESADAHLRHDFHDPAHARVAISLEDLHDLHSLLILASSHLMIVDRRVEQFQMPETVTGLVHEIGTDRVRAEPEEHAQVVDYFRLAGLDDQPDLDWT